MGCKTRGMAEYLILQVYSLDEIKGPEVPVIMLRTEKGDIYHHGTSSAGGMIDGIICESVVVMSTHDAVLDVLAL